MSLKELVKAALPPAMLQVARRAVWSARNLRQPRDVFRGIYQRNDWGDPESISGPGSSIRAAKNLRAALPGLLQEYGIRSMLDIPCGDLCWIKDILPRDLRYIGADIVPDLIEENRKQHPGVGSFEVLNLATDPLPKVDLVLVRDCLIHLPFAMGVQAIANVKKAGIPYLLVSTYEDVGKNEDVYLGGYRPLNLRLAPYNLPRPQVLIRESDDPKHFGKSMGLWKTSDLA